MRPADVPQSGSELQLLVAWIHCPGWMATYLLPVLMAVLLALTAGILARAVIDLRHPVPIGDFKETPRTEAQGLVVAALGCFVWAMLEANIAGTRNAAPALWAPWLHMAIAATGICLFLRGLLRLQINFYTRRPAPQQSAGPGGTDADREFYMQAGPLPSRGNWLQQAGAGNFLVMLAGAALLSLLLAAIRTPGTCR